VLLLILLLCVLLHLYNFPPSLQKCSLFLNCLTLQDGRIGCPETLLRNYNSTLHKNPRRAKISSSYRLIPFLRILQLDQCLAKFFHLHLTLNRRFPEFLISVIFAHVQTSPEGTVSFILTHLPQTSSPLHFYSFLNISAAYGCHSASPNKGGGGCGLFSRILLQSIVTSKSLLSAALFHLSQFFYGHQCISLYPTYVLFCIYITRDSCH